MSVCEQCTARLNALAVPSGQCYVCQDTHKFQTENRELKKQVEELKGLFNEKVKQLNDQMQMNMTLMQQAMSQNAQAAKRERRSTAGCSEDKNSDTEQEMLDDEDDEPKCYEAMFNVIGGELLISLQK